MNSGNSNTSDPHRLLLNLTDEINLKRSDKYVALSKLSIYDTWKNIKKSYKNKKCKISAPTWIKQFELSGGSYSVSDISDYFKYIFKKHETTTDNLWVKICRNKMKNRKKIKIQTRYYLEFLTPETMKLLGINKSKIIKMKTVKICLFRSC